MNLPEALSRKPTVKMAMSSRLKTRTSASSMDGPVSNAEAVIGKSGSDGINADKTKMSSNSLSPKFLSDEAKGILQKSAMCSKLSEDQIDYFLQVVERTKLDPYAGQIRPDIRMTKNAHGEKEPTLLIITTLAGLRTIGERSGQHDGESPIEWCDAEGEWKDVWLNKEPPLAARASVYRKDRNRPQTEIARWDAYVQLQWDQKGNAVPNRFWERMGSLMIGKCARAAAYRGAYPDPCSGLYITEEIGAELDPDSEEAIEAEMIRRARDEKAYWAAEREKGNLPIDEQQRRDGIFPRSEQPAPVQPNAVHPLEVTSIPTRVDKADWQSFVIRRIELFKGRSVGSLNATELQGMGSWMAKVEKSWPSLDEDMKAHYKAIKARMDYERETVALADGLDFSTPVKSDEWRP
jgi:phage recombination protein Bet